RLGFSKLMERHLSDSRRGKNIQLPLADLLRQSIYSRLAGYEDVNDAKRLSQDPTFRLIGSRKIWERGAALTSRLQSFETEVLTREENLAGLATFNRELVGKAEAIDSPRRVVLDMDSTEVRVHGAMCSRARSPTAVSWACSQNAHRASEKSLTVGKESLCSNYFTLPVLARWHRTSPWKRQVPSTKQYGSTFVPTISANRSILRSIRRDASLL